MTDDQDAGPPPPEAEAEPPAGLDVEPPAEPGDQPASQQRLEQPVEHLPDPELATASWGREGYSSAEVDAFVTRLRAATQHQPPTMAPYEVADQRFRVTRFGQRYSLEPVDEFLETAEARLREVHGEDAVAHVEGRAPEPRHFPTGWIYLVALVLVAVMVAFLVTQL